jgi:hypothetical protein
VVPCVDDAASYMLALGCCLLGVGRLLDVDGQLGLGPGRHRRLVLIAVAAAAANRAVGRTGSKTRFV